MRTNEDVLNNTSSILFENAINSVEFGEIPLTAPGVNDDIDPSIAYSIVASTVLYPPANATGGVENYYIRHGIEPSEFLPLHGGLDQQIRTIASKAKIGNRAIFGFAPDFQQISHESMGHFPTNNLFTIIELCKKHHIPLGVVALTKIVYCETTDEIGSNQALLFYPYFASPVIILSYYKTLLKTYRPE